MIALGSTQLHVSAFEWWYFASVAEELENGESRLLIEIGCLNLYDFN